VLKSFKHDPGLEFAGKLANVVEITPETMLPIEEDMQDNVFDANYRRGWGSGLGSLVSSTATYRYIIESFIRLNDVHSVLDLGCGDWQFSKLIPWDNYDISYLGLDLSHVIIEKNTATYGTERRQFKVIREPSEIFDLGRFDLVLCKDVLIHVPNSVANEYLDVFVAVARYALITVDAFPSDRINEDINTGDYRGMDLRKPPFSRNSTIIAEYVNFSGHNFYVKHVHLLTGQGHCSQADTLISAGEAVTGEEIRTTLRHLRPNAAKGFNKARFGSPNDGGYVLLDDFSGVDTAFSFGIEQNASWDIDVARRGLTVYQFDHTVDVPISGDPRFIFAKKRISAEAGPDRESLTSLIERHDKQNTNPNILMKLDIECEEWAVFDATPSEMLSRFSQIVGEFHYFQAFTDPYWRHLFARVLQKLSNHYAVVHVHANNYGGFSNIANVVVPNVLEITFANRAIYSFSETDEIFPGPLDEPNDPSRPDMFLGSFRF
jgi:SAM-dependent methyltransferase